MYIFTHLEYVYIVNNITYTLLLFKVVFILALSFGVLS